MRRRKRWEVGKGSLASRLFGAVHIHDHIWLVEPIPHSARGREGRRSLQQVFLKLRAQRLDSLLIEGGKKARKGRARGQVMATKQRHEDVCKGSKTFIKGLKGRFSTERIAQKHDHEIHRVILTKACAGKLHVFLDSFEQTDMAQHLSESCHFSHPGWG